jgi:hypothetical protein
VTNLVNKQPGVVKISFHLQSAESVIDIHLYLNLKSLRDPLRAEFCLVNQSKPQYSAIMKIQTDTHFAGLFTLSECKS